MTTHQKDAQAGKDGDGVEERVAYQAPAMARGSSAWHVHDACEGRADRTMSTPCLEMSGGRRKSEDNVVKEGESGECVWRQAEKRRGVIVSSLLSLSDLGSQLRGLSGHPPPSPPAPWLFCLCSPLN